MWRVSKSAFVREQGFTDIVEGSCGTQHRALMFQPRVVGAIIVVGLVSQWPGIFLALSAILWWNVLLPALNPFDALYNRLIAAPRNLPRLGPAPAPRRFAQGMAATFLLAISLALLWGWQITAWVFEGAMVAAMAALVFANFCLGSFVFHVLAPGGPARAESARH